jgi:purine-nucleoside phosphorylase
VAAKLGVHTLISTCAAGTLQPTVQVPSLYIIKDHINLLPQNPLVGPDPTGNRFPDMFNTYDQDLRNEVYHLATKILNLPASGLPVMTGTYAAILGPNLETPAEYRYLRVIGADLVGMSTVPEVIAAVHQRLRVLALAVATDACDPGRLKRTELSEILHAASIAAPGLRSLLKRVIQRRDPKDGLPMGG